MNDKNKNDRKEAKRKIMTVRSGGVTIIDAATKETPTAATKPEKTNK